jgi:hypothetical protein
VVAYTWGDEKLTHTSGWKAYSKYTTWKTSAAGRIILKLVLKRRLRIC